MNVCKKSKYDGTLIFLLYVLRNDTISSKLTCMCCLRRDSFICVCNVSMACKDTIFLSRGRSNCEKRKVRIFSNRASCVYLGVLESNWSR